jgi:hypothetical protein
VRLTREGAVLAADARALRDRGHALTATPVRVWRDQVLAWAAEVLAHQRRVAAWGTALADRRRRRRERLGD